MTLFITLAIFEILFFIFFIIFPILALIDILINKFIGNKKLFWIILVLILNIVGVIIYLFLGKSQKTRCIS